MVGPYGVCLGFSQVGSVSCGPSSLTGRALRAVTLALLDMGAVVLASLTSTGFSVLLFMV